LSERRYRRAGELEGPQRAAAEARGNVVVAAGAGSGKTTVLAARYVRLLEEGRLDSGERVGVRNILVLTFTRKAAAEMYGRIYGALAESAASVPDEELRAHLASCLSDFSQAQISTFDSFAARIARSGSSRFGAAPDFAIDEDRARKAASGLALSFLLERREDEAVRDLVSALGLEGAREDVLAALAVGRMSVSSPPSFATFHAAQGPILARMEAEAREALVSLRSAVLEYSGTRTTDTAKRWLDAMSGDPGGDEASFAAFAAGLEGLRKPSSASKDELSRFLSDTVDDIRKAVGEYRSVAATKAAHPARIGLYRLLDDFREAWDAERRRTGALSFGDVARLALDTLESDRELRRHYQGLYRYAMIDEFQDDNELQKRLLFLIAGAEPGPARQLSGAEPAARGPADDRLFFVGDEKQSIYLFRGADVSVFRRLPAELGAEALPLSRNFRSEPGIIGMINAIFPEVMAPSDPDGRYEEFEARFERLDSRRPTPGVTPRFVYLELPYRGRARGDGPASGDPRIAYRDPAECEAWEVARLVRDSVEAGSLEVADRESGRARPARYEDFAILLRSTGKQVHFEKYLRLLGVPYASENACGLFSEAVACDLYYALRLAIHPDDRNALAAFLRSPFAGLSDEAVVRLLLESRERPRGAPLDPFGEEGPALVPAADRPALARGAETMARLADRIDREPIAATVSYLWFEAGYRAALLRDPVASAFEEHFELVHSMAALADERRAGLAAFVSELEPLLGEPDKQEIDLPRDGSAGVRIMTVHKSKGLEFPIVVIPQANNVGREGSSREAWYWDDETGPTFKPPAAVGEKSRNAFFDRSTARREAMDAAELKRLLYVALTRAESHVIVTATEPRNEDAKGRSFRSLLARGLGLFALPSPLAPGAEDGSARSLDLPPFGSLAALPSGALVGLIPERSDLEYYDLLESARTAPGARTAPTLRSKPSGRSETVTAETLAAIPLVERGAAPTWVAITALAAAIESGREEEAEEAEAAQPLPADPALLPPPALSATTWGSLAHEILESRLAPPVAAGRAVPGAAPSAALRDRLEGELGGGAGAEKAIAAAERLAEVFLRSELGRRAAAASERAVELEVAIALDGPRGSPRWARGVIDLAFIEADRVVVVDYKTDAAIYPRRHAAQLGEYARAAESIFKKRPEAWVFYLYGGGRAVRLDGLNS
jgi:ATP-dependent exoDNAse (exonuclease V) beta subunit